MIFNGDYKPRDPAIHPPGYHPAYKTTVLRSPTRALVPLHQTLTERTGPIFTRQFLDPLDSDLIANARVDADPIGERMVVYGRVLDENAHPVRNTLIEVWQANAAGRYRHRNDSYMAPLDPNFGGAGRCLTDDDGWYMFRTIKPGPYPWPNGHNAWRPAHIHLSLFGPAFTTRLITQMYFQGDPLLPLCPIYNSVPDDEARQRLVAPLDMDAATPHDSLAYRFDIVLAGAQGDTVRQSRVRRTGMLKETASQTAGPYVHIGLDRREGLNVVAGDGAAGERIRIEGVVYDGAGEPVRDALIEIWQANAHGKYDHPEDTQDKPVDPAFSGWGRCACDRETGLFHFETVKPGPVPGRDVRMQAPHVNVTIFARGVNSHLVTRLYFDDEIDANASDPVLNALPSAQGAQTLIARRESREGRNVYRFDIRLQGDGETVFFDV
uniref:Protocatechuate 34-dioxygenase alpha subunit n=1 Tax=Arhodomonas sp. Seminole TaxID=1204713 RepID=A0A076YGY3_9GAMM|nr:protocatechuate 34-dioxygenase alpha subunit [Arhodomonas sp. Seminole]